MSAIAKALGLAFIFVVSALIVALWAPLTLAAEGQAVPVPTATAAPATGQQPAPVPAKPSAAAAAPALAQAAEYRIQPGDTLAITVLGSAEYSGSFPVQSDGTILFHDDMVGSVSVGGSTVKEASARLMGRIGEYIKDPTIVLSIGQFRVMVMGEVQRAALPTSLRALG